jgi:hypothetical protein
MTNTQPLPPAPVLKRSSRLLGASALAALLGAGSILTTTALVSTPSAAHAQVAFGVSVNFAPPALPIYAQPAIPGPGYLWQPGYWAWDGDDGDYYWVPGAWVLAPQPGLLWTPAYWGWNDGAYLFHEGYWGPQVGFYGGIAYGFGYTGFGYAGGYWNNNHFFYNRAVNNISNVRITNVYNRTVVNNQGSRASFNGPGGVAARPTAQQLAAARGPHVGPTSMQRQNARMAMAQPQFRASANHGVPPVAATAHAGSFHGAGVVTTARAGSATPYRGSGKANAFAGRQNTGAQASIARGGAAAGHTSGSVAAHGPGAQQSLARGGQATSHMQRSFGHAANAQQSLATRSTVTTHAHGSLGHTPNGRQFARSGAAAGHAQGAVGRGPVSHQYYAHARANVSHAPGSFGGGARESAFARSAPTRPSHVTASVQHNPQPAFARGGAAREHASAQFTHNPAPRPSLARSEPSFARGGPPAGHAPVERAAPSRQALAHSAPAPSRGPEPQPRERRQQG